MTSEMHEPVRAFLQTEEAVRALLVETEGVRHASSRLATTEETLNESSNQLASVAGSLNDLVQGLEAIASDLRSIKDEYAAQEPEKLRAQLLEVQASLLGFQVQIAGVKETIHPLEAEVRGLRRWVLIGAAVSMAVLVIAVILLTRSI